jgi:hypothetical protein
MNHTLTQTKPRLQQYAALQVALHAILHSIQLFHSYKMNKIIFLSLDSCVE